MLEVLAQVLPMNLAAILSPGLFAAALFLLGTKKPRLNTLVLLLGSVAVALGVVATGALLGDPHPDEGGEKLFAVIIDFLFGGIFIFLAFKILFFKEKNKKLRLLSDVKYWQIFIFGVVVNATNFDAVLLSLAAAKEVADSPDISNISKGILYIVNMLFFTLPIWLPLVFYLVAPKVAMPLMKKVNKYVIKYSKYIIGAVFLVLGGWLLYEGIRFFL